MNPVRILASATAMEIAVAAAVPSIAGLAGSRNGWLDVINNFAPMTLGMGSVGGALASVSVAGATRLRRAS